MTPENIAANAFDSMLKTIVDYNKVVESEKTKRQQISAWRDVELGKIRTQKDILEKYLTESFEERKFVIEKMFERLDKAIESGDENLMSLSMSGIVTIVKTSPLAQAIETLENIRDPKVKSIDW